MKTKLLALLVLATPLTVQAAGPISAGLVLSDPVGFGGFLSFWPLDALSIDGVLTHAVADVGVTGHIQLGADPAHRLLAAADIGHVHNSSRTLVVGTHIGLAVGYGYQSEWDVRLLCGIGGQGATGGTFGPAFSLLVGRFF